MRHGVTWPFWALAFLLHSGIWGLQNIACYTAAQMRVVFRTTVGNLFFVTQGSINTPKA